MRRTNSLYVAVSIALALIAFTFPAFAGTIKGVGLLRIGAVDPVSLKPMDVAAFYPALNSNNVSAVGPYDIDAERQSPIMPGAYPVIIISHGNSGGLWGHHDLASNLAREGFIVVTLTHPGDNYLDGSGAGAISTVYGRPLQISAALDAALKESSLAPYINKRLIAFIGFSSGGQTGLLLAGARPDFHRLETYCKSWPHAPLCENKGQIRIDRPDLLPVPDARIRAFILMAPLSVSFSAETLRAVDVPVMLYVGENDRELAPDENTCILGRELPRLFKMEVVPNAGHWVFLAPCSDRLLQAAPSLCIDEPYIDRKALHKKMSADIADFLRQLQTEP